MEIIQNNITIVASTLTLLAHILFVVVILGILVNKKFRSAVYAFVNKYVLHLILGASLSAFVGSLAYSNIVGFPPCELCWIQRIFLYPQVFVSFLALTRGDKGIVDYLLPLSLLGGAVALYHSLTHYGLGDGLLECTSALGDCGKLYVLEYGYITIPLMSFTIFAYLIAISFIYSRSSNVRG